MKTTNKWTLIMGLGCLISTTALVCVLVPAAAAFVIGGLTWLGLGFVAVSLANWPGIIIGGAVVAAAWAIKRWDVKRALRITKTRQREVEAALPRQTVIERVVAQPPATAPATAPPLAAPVAPALEEKKPA